jgi:hypothetical protein
LKTLFLAWQDPDSRAWSPVGRLTSSGGVYQFVYTKGAERVEREFGFEPLESFPVLTDLYESSELFPLFANRVLQRSREEYGEYTQWLNLPLNEDDPIAILARSGGRRATDSLAVFPCPEPDRDGNFHIHFFVHGIRHTPPASIERMNQLIPGEKLLLMLDFQNSHDSGALALRTEDLKDRDLHIVGYCPRYLLPDAFEVLNQGSVEVKVERLNPSPVPLQFRLMCSMTSRWPRALRPCTSDDYRPIIADPALTDTPD